MQEKQWRKNAYVILMNHKVDQYTLRIHPTHSFPQTMINEKKKRKISSKFLKTVMMDLHYKYV